MYVIYYKKNSTVEIDIAIMVSHLLGIIGTVS